VKKKIITSQERVETLATLEVTKTLAFFGLLAGLRALGGDQRARLKNLENSLKAYYSTIETDLSDDETLLFRKSCLKILDELLERVRIGDQQLKPEIDS
jgi:hypothetical protein